MSGFYGVQQIKLRKHGGMNMYFVNEEHEYNFYRFLERYPIAIKDNEYRSAFYIVALPQIYNFCNGNPVTDGHGPFDWFFNESTDTSGLSNGYRQLVLAGIHLYNNYDEFSLYLSLGTWGTTLFNVFIESCKIRCGEYA
jgi:hypothetical protein